MKWLPFSIKSWYRRSPQGGSSVPSDSSKATDWDAERESHLQMRTELNQQAGMAPEAARREAERRFGNRTRIAEDVRAVWVPLWWDQLRQDGAHALRSLPRNPGFTAAVLLAVALGVGAGTAVFSVVDRILFRALPYPEEDRIVSFGLGSPLDVNEFLQGADYLEWRDTKDVFERTTSMRADAPACELTEGEPARLGCASVEKNFLAVFGLRPFAGQDFLPEDDLPGAPPAVLLSHSFWTSRLGGRAIVGSTIEINSRKVLVRGILPPEFEMPNLARPDVLFSQQLEEGRELSRQGQQSYLRAYARLKHGVSLEQAAARLQPMFQNALRYVPAGYRKEVFLVIQSVRDRQLRDSRAAAWLLLGAVGLVMAIAIANVANLLLGRAAARRREMTVRAALGASAWRLARQALTESLLLGILGGMCGAVIAWGLLRVLIRVAPEGIPRLAQATLDSRVLLALFVMSILSGLLFGLAPAVQPFSSALEFLAGSRVTGGRSEWLRRSLVVAQLALSLMLLSGAGLLLQSLWNMANARLGIEPAGLLIAQMQLPAARYPQRTQALAFYELLDERVARIPGVIRSALSDSLPPMGRVQTIIYASIAVDGRAPQTGRPTGGMVVHREVTPAYFQALGIPVTGGRTFTETDRAAPERTVVLSQRLASRLFPEEEAVGRRLRLPGTEDWHTVIGVVADARNSGLAGNDDPELYRVKRHEPASGRAYQFVIIQTAGDPARYAPTVRQVVRDLDPRLTVQIQPFETRLRQITARPRFQTLLLGGFALAGLLLAGIGLYGVISLLVAQRTTEIGVRVALGATPGAIHRMVLAQAGRWLAIGLVLGLTGAAAGGRLLGTLLYGTSPANPLALGAAVAILLLAGLTAAWVPANRAARTQPSEALRHN